MTKPTILLIGAAGQLGQDLIRPLARHADLTLAARRPLDEPSVGHHFIELDLGDFEGLRAAVRSVSPRAIVNAAAYTAVDKAESEPQAAHRINALAPGILAEEATRAGAVLLHYSTDYVFDGASQRPWLETDDTCPLNEYGRSKLAGEQAVLNAGKHFVLRTSWLYGAGGRNFARTILTRWLSGAPLRVVDDQVGSPTSTRSLAEASAQLLAAAFEHGAPWLPERAGVYHATAAGSVSWFGFAREIVKVCARYHETGQDTGMSITPVSSGEFPAPAARPAYSVLDGARLASVLGAPQPTWQAQLSEIARDLSPYPQIAEPQPRA